MNSNNGILSRTPSRELPEPVPAAGIEAYIAEREKALESSVERRENYKKYKAFLRGEMDVDYLPVKMDIENVSRCNFRCIMCPVSDWKGGKRADDMTFEAFKKIIDEQIGLVEIKLQGLGETTIQRGPFYEMIRYARSKFIWVRTTTNASLLHLENGYKRLIDADPNEVQISIDGASKDVFEKIRRGSVFRHVMRNCELINSYSKSVGVDRTKMWTVVQRDNLDQLEDLVRLAANLGFSNQVFSLDLSDWGDESWLQRNSEIDVEDKISDERLLSLVELGRSLSIRVGFWFVTQKFDSANAKTVCHWPFERAFISSDLRVVPCCILGNPDTYQIGDKITEENSFSKIWFSEPYKEFRRGHIAGEIPNVCKGCYKSKS